MSRARSKPRDSAAEVVRLEAALPSCTSRRRRGAGRRHGSVDRLLVLLERESCSRRDRVDVRARCRAATRARSSSSGLRHQRLVMRLVRRRGRLASARKLRYDRATISSRVGPSARYSRAPRRAGSRGAPVALWQLPWAAVRVPRRARWQALRLRVQPDGQPASGLADMRMRAPEALEAEIARSVLDPTRGEKPVEAARPRCRTRARAVEPAGLLQSVELASASSASARNRSA